MEVRSDVEPSCQADRGYGTYSWTFADDLLAFTLVDDGCSARRTLFTAGAWRRVP